jgi:hypothetical protein
MPDSGYVRHRLNVTQVPARLNLVIAVGSGGRKSYLIELFAAS